MEVSSLRSDLFQEVYANVNTAQYEPKRELKLRGFRAGLFTAYAILLAVGVAGNCWVITVIGRLLRQPRTEAPRSVQIYIFALCCCDLFALSFVSLLLLDLAYGHWIIPVPWLCKLYWASESVNKFGTPFLLTSLTSFCYATICRQTKSQTPSTNNSIRSTKESVSCRLSCNPTSPRFALALVFLCTLTGTALVAPIYMFSDVYYVVVHNGSQLHLLLPKCILQPPEGVLTVFTVYSFILAYVVPSVLVTFFYASVLHYVRINGTWMRAERSQRFWRVAKTSMGLVGFYLACWTPYWACQWYYYFTPHTNTASVGGGGRTHTGLVLSYFVHMLPYINCSGYPILYTLLNRRIRDDYSKAKAVSRDRRRRRQLAAARGSIFSNHSSNGTATSVQHALGGAVSWLCAFTHRQRNAMRKGWYSSPETNSVEISVHQVEESANCPSNAHSANGLKKFSRTMILKDSNFDTMESTR